VVLSYKKTQGQLYLSLYLYMYIGEVIPVLNKVPLHEDILYLI